MALGTYRRKRNFAVSPEPPGKSASKQRFKRPAGKRVKRPDKRSKIRAGRIFVVQEHHASRLHWDFRLEADGVLKSWAVPKGPSMDPRDKRLAVEVEDHPLSYGDFHGDIPEGQYGAGHVEIWDRGTYQNVMEQKIPPVSMGRAIHQGHVEVDLHGRRLNGRFALVRLAQERGGKHNWLLMKMREPGRPVPQRQPDTPARRPGPQSAKRKHADDHEMPSRAAKQQAESPPRQVIWTHEQREMFPEAGLTKKDLLSYYQSISKSLLPYLKDRPATLERLPEGLVSGGARFWQKNTPRYYPSWIPRVQLATERGKPVNYVVVNDEPTLMYLVNQGTVTFHINFSRMQDLKRPDFVLFDLDPGPARFAEVVKVARQLHAALQQRGIEAWVKTSGRSGLHVLTLWQQDGGFDEARRWAMQVAQDVVAQAGELATVQRRIKRRGRRVYIDVMQNALGHHAVPPYVIRAVEQATVSAPLKWSEVTARLDPRRFDTRTMLRRLSATGRQLAWLGQ